MKAPRFWYHNNSFWTKLLKPLGAVYAWSVAHRFQKVHPYQASIPVICVGNLSVGGTGKTPVCLALADFFKLKKKSIHFLNHGYKSRLKNVVVDTRLHSAFDVGDEALLLASKAPTIVDNHRARGAQLAIKNGAQRLIMDDGFQNPSLIKTVSFVVVDGKKGFGNMHVLPAGPLREPVLKGLKRADAVIIVGEDAWGVRDFLNKNVPDLTILSGRFVPDKRVIQALKGKNVMAFAGIGDPEKFFSMLAQYGVSVQKKQPFPDHYFYSRFDMEQLFQDAHNLELVTTSKDAVKIPKEFYENLKIIDGVFKFDDLTALEEVLKEVL